MNDNIFRCYSVEQLNAQYNKRAEVPDHQTYFARWQEMSQNVRRELTVAEDIAYGATERETLDAFPARSDGAPVVVFIHGGYWQAMDKSYFSFIAPPLVDRGFTVVVLNYPLCPAVKLRDIVSSVRWAMIYLYRNVARYNGDRERFHVVGHSAGGHLAAMLLATSWRKLDSSIGGAFLRSATGISGVYELEPLRYTLINQALNLDPSEVHQLSPIRLSPQVEGAMDLIVGAGESDEFKRQSRQFMEAWSGDRFIVTYRLVDNHNHFSILDEIIRPDGVVLTRLAERSL